MFAALETHTAQLVLTQDGETEGGKTLYGKELNFKIHSTEKKIYLEKMDISQRNLTCLPLILIVLCIK